MELTSPVFVEHAAIPSHHTCEGDDVSPPLAWRDVPPGTRSLALVVDDPDAPDPAKPERIWVHWVVYDIPPYLDGMPEGADLARIEARAGLNDWKKASYGGPCPPTGRHRYFFKLYALDRALGELKPPTKATLEQAMQRHVLAEAQLIGTYRKERG